MSDVIERAQRWLQAADERGINRTDEDGYLSVISDLVDELDRLRAENEQLRELLNVHNLGGWTDALTAIKERDEARAQLAERTRERDEHARWRQKLADQLHDSEGKVLTLTRERDEARAALQPFTARNSSDEFITITVRTADVTKARRAAALSGET